MRSASAGRHVDLRTPRGYYVDHSGCADPRGPVDDDGLPLIPRPVDGHSHSPLAVARFGLGNLELYLGSGSADRRDRFECAARFLVQSIEVVPSSFGGWAMPPAPPPYGRMLPAGRLSAGPQGECLSTVVRAWTLLGTPGAEETASSAAAALAAPVSDGGLLREIGEPTGDAGIDSLAFLEEYPIDARPVLDLSGHARGLLGVHDYWLACGDASAASLRERCLKGLAFVIDRYDLGYWTRDDLDGASPRVRVSSAAALGEHVLHASVLADISGMGLFRDTSSRWHSYESSPLCRLRALAGRAGAMAVRTSPDR